jgi:hypothetical protein
MKELTLNIVAVLSLALVLGLAFRLLYPRVEITAELAGLIVFVALVLKLAFSKLWSMKKKAGP